jgi:ABC-type transport system involved in cytochrome bd biosynthesis fused ATPase/permease subunit
MGFLDSLVIFALGFVTCLGVILLVIHEVFLKIERKFDAKRAMYEHLNHTLLFRRLSPLLFICMFV